MKKPVNTMPTTRRYKKTDLKRAVGNLIIVGYSDAPIRCGLLLPIIEGVGYRFLTYNNRGKFLVATFDDPKQVHHIDTTYAANLALDFCDCLADLLHDLEEAAGN